MSPQVPAAAPAAPVVAAPDPAARLAALEAENTALKGSVTEHQNNARFWFDKAKTAAPAAPAKAAEPEAETDMLELLTTGGEKGLLKLLKTKGFMSTEQAEHMIESRVSQVQSEQKLLKDYPDLADATSDFFKATAVNYGELKKRGVPEGLASRLAAEQAELQGLQSGKLKTPAQKIAEAAAAKAADRAARAAAGGGERGSRMQEPSPEDDALTENDNAAIRNLADALDIPIKDSVVDGKTVLGAESRYVARAKAGVNVALKLDRGRR
jgi:hypothetical protein